MACSLKGGTHRGTGRAARKKERGWSRRCENEVLSERGATLTDIGLLRNAAPLDIFT